MNWCIFRQARAAWDWSHIDEGDGWVDWSGLATLVADVGRVVSNCLECLLGEDIGRRVKLTMTLASRSRQARF